MKKTVSIFLVAVMLIVVSMSTVVKADVTLTKSKPSSCSFSKAWERTAYIYFSDKDMADYLDAYIGELCYGFDKVLVKEDYVWTRSHFYKHKSIVQNDKGTYESSAKKKSTGTKWAKIEVTHKGDSPKYKIKFIGCDYSKSDFNTSEVVKSTNK